MFQCMECGKKFKTVKAAENAQSRGCPKCGGSDIDLAPAAPPPTRPATRSARGIEALSGLAQWARKRAQQ